MSKDAQISVTVRIMKREYHVSCAPDEVDILHAAARHVDREMGDIRSRGHVIGTDRIAVLTALNMAAQLLRVRDNQAIAGRVHESIETLRQQLAEGRRRKKPS